MKQYFTKLFSGKKIILFVVSMVFVISTCIALFVLNDTQTEKSEQALTDIKTLQSAAYNVGILNAGFAEDVNVLAEQLNNNLYLSMSVTVKNNVVTTLEKDPWGNEYQIKSVKESDTSCHLDIISSGPDKKFNTNDDVISTLVYSENANGSNVIIVEPEISKDYETSHICLFNQKVENQEFLKSLGNCTTPASYYYSCVCGEKGTVTYNTLVNKSIHTGEKIKTYSTLNETTHQVYVHCLACDEEVESKTESHSFDSQNICDRCSYIAHTHSFVIKDTANEYFHKYATCSVPMSYYYSCSCKAIGDQLFFVGTTLAHTMTDTIIEPTCQQEGKKVSKCSVCNTIEETTYPKLEHNFVQIEKETTLKTPANCHTYAQYYESCADCGTHGDELFYGTIYNNNQHDGETRLVYDYVNEEKHVVNVYCNGCNISIDKKVLVHEFDSTRTCVLCNNHVHTYNMQDNLQMSTPANCQFAAKYFYNCVCGTVGSMTYSYGEIDKANHSGTEIFAGSQNSHTVYSCCGVVISSEHEYKVNVQDPTCNNTGLKTYTCDCGYIYDETLSVIEHKYVANMSVETLVKPATCVSYGQYYYSCEMCNKISDQTFFGTDYNANNHSSVANVMYQKKDNIHHTMNAYCVDCQELVNTMDEEHVFKNNTCIACQYHEHNFTYTDNLILRTPANCLAKATYYYNCSCGEVSNEYYEYGEIDTSNHALDVKLVGEANIHSQYECCQKVVSREHVYKDNIEQKPTCDSTGLKVYTCECGYKYDVKLDALKHSYKEIVNDVTVKEPANCISPATYYIACEYCFEKTDATFVNGETNPQNHVGEETLHYSDTSSLDEHSVIVTCNSCTEVKEQYTKEHMLNDMSDCVLCGAHRHQYVHQDDLVMKSAANCTNKATYYFNCYCGAIGEDIYETGEPNAIFHTSDSIPMGTPDVCQQYECCGSKIKAHILEQNIVIKPSCTNEGLNEYTCEFCQYTYQETVDALPHVYNKVVNKDNIAMPATCSASTTYYLSCECGQKSHETFTYGDVDANNHVNIYNKYSYNTYDDHTKTIVCADCGTIVDSYTEAHEFDSTQNCTICESHFHNFNREVVHERFLKDAVTCEVPALYYYSCVCGDASDEYFEYGEALGHEPIFCGNETIHTYCKHCKFVIKDASYHVMEATVQIPVTCTNIGVTEYACECGYKYIEQTEPLNHNFNVKSDIYLKTKPTCKTNAVYYYTCECGLQGTTSYIAPNTKIPHSFYNERATDNALIIAPTCQSPGVYVRSCNYCSTIDTDRTNTFTFGSVDQNNHANSYKKYHVVNDDYHSVIVVCPACSYVSEPITEKHNLQYADYEGYCKECDHTIHYHNYNQYVCDDQYIAKQATCIQPAEYYYSCRCGEAGSTRFTSDIFAEHEEIFAGTQSAHTVCKICNAVLNNQHEFYKIEQLCKASVRDEIYFALCDLYGSGSRVWYNKDGITPYTQHEISVRIINENVSVFVSFLPSSAREIAINNMVNVSSDEYAIGQKLRKIYGNSSGVSFSYSSVNDCRYPLTIEVNGSLRNIFVSAVVGNNPIGMIECPTAKNVIYFCECGFSRQEQTGTQHISDNVITCEKGFACIYCHKQLSEPKEHIIVQEYINESVFSHRVVTKCKDCGLEYGSYTETHKLFDCPCKKNEYEI